MTDLQQVSLALRLSTKRSLVLLDEFGKGTSSSGNKTCRVDLRNRGHERQHLIAWFRSTI